MGPIYDRTQENLRSSDRGVIQMRRLLIRTLEARGPRSVRACVLLDKTGRRETPITVDYVGFTIPNVFVVGYGLDYDGLYRNLPYVATLEGI